MNKKLSFFIISVISSLLLLSWVYVSRESYSVFMSKKTQMNIEKTVINLGQLDRNKPQSAIYPFTNTGKNPLIIQQVETSCGCTQPEWPKHPIKPGKKGHIKVTYDAKYPGRFVKRIKVFCNIEKGYEELVVKGEVLYEDNR
ncbi:MAG: DUF1573 domain-containing protein [Marinilabiliaceae bacterium]|nr:DUF1573 domain-containing protein [Marinilabiliaceae bacterium]